MTPEFIPWLPQSALMDTRLLHQVEASASAWAERWFGRHAVRVRQCEITGMNAAQPQEWAITSVGDNLVLSTAEPSLLAMSGAQLGIEMDREALSEADRALLSELAARSLEDFLGELSVRLLGLPGHDNLVSKGRLASGNEAAISFRIESEAEGLDLCLDVPRCVAVAARKQALEKPAEPAALESRYAAIARQQVKVGAKIGEAELGLAELYSLGDGDVVVLDGRGGDTFQLTINGEVQRASGCQILRDDDAFKLCVTNIELGGVS